MEETGSLALPECRLPRGLILARRREMEFAMGSKVGLEAIAFDALD